MYKATFLYTYIYWKQLWLLFDKSLESWPWVRYYSADSSLDIAEGEVVEKSRVAEEDGRADGEEGEPATRPGDQEEEQEEKEENASHHHLPMSYKPVKPGKQDLDAQKDHTKENSQKLTVFFLLSGPLLFFHQFAIAITLHTNLLSHFQRLISSVFVSDFFKLY